MAQYSSDHTKIFIPAWVEGILKPVEKLEVHQKGLMHKAVSVFVVRNGKVLIQRRALSKYHSPGLWANTCCTHPKWNEDGLTCAKRRLQEELAIENLDLEPRGHLEYRADVGAGLIEHEKVEVFLAEASQDLSVCPNPEEVMEVRWVDITELTREIEKDPDRFTAWLRIYVRDHSHQIYAGVARDLPPN